MYFSSYLGLMTMMLVQLLHILVYIYIGIYCYIYINKTKNKQTNAVDVLLYNVLKPMKALNKILSINWQT